MKVEDKKAKGTKECEDYKNCLETTQLGNKINYLEKNEIEADSLKKIIENLYKTIE